MTSRLRLLVFVALLIVPASLFALAPHADLIVPLTAEDLQALDNSNEQRYRVGVVTPAEALLDLSSVTPESLTPGRPQFLPFGRIERTANGFAWSGSIESPGAAALRIHFSDFFLPRNATLTLAGAGPETFSYTELGPNATGEFWSNTLRGERVEFRVEYQGNDLGRVLKALHFAVVEVGPISSRLPVADPQAGDELCPYNEPCVLNASCVALPNAVTTARKAVAMILFISGPYQYVCSGGLIADSDPNSAVPYFMTANHCLSSNNEAQTVEAYFDYTTPCGTCDDGISDEPRTLGSSVVSANRTSDYTLLRLSQAAPTGTAFLTWNNTPVSGANRTPLYRISHPAGAPQAYSAQEVDTSRPTCQSWPRGAWIYSTDTVGATEGGSSGSPVVNANGQFVGQLSGACGYNTADPCDSVQNATVDGAFAAYYNSVAPYLGAPSTCTDADGDGVCASQGDCNDNNPAVNPSAAEVCNDGIDNDCDGLVDAADPTCQSSGCDLLPAKSPCTTNDQCCSGSCKGKPGAKTCK